MPPPDKEAKISCPTPQHLQAELDALAAVLEVREQEDTWEKMERAIIRFAGVTRGGGYKHLPLFTDGLGKMGVGLKLGACMLSDRGRLSGVATELLQTLAPRLGSHFLPLVSVLMPPLVQLLGRPNKVFLKRAEKCLWTIISHCHLPTILVELKKGLSDDAATCRRGCAAAFERALIDWDRETFGEKGVGLLEDALRKAGTDKDPEVRATGKRLWTKYGEMWPERVDEFAGPLTPTIRRYLGVAAASNAGPSKPKAPVRPPAARPLPPTLSASSSSAHIASTVGQTEVVQHTRVQALGGRAVRPVPLPTMPPIAPITEQETEAAPDASAPMRARRSPTKVSVPFPVAGPSAPAIPPMHDRVDMGEPIRQRVISTRAPRYPPGVLGHAGRSVSHNVLSLASETPLPPDDPARNPLGNPSRPAFPTSFSTNHLPTDAIGGEAWSAARRLPGPARIIRQPALSTMDEADTGSSGGSHHPLPPTIPHVLRGAVKSTQAHAPGQQAGPGGKRGLGQAQRRAVTAPMPACPPPPEVDYTPLPSAALRASTSVRDRIHEMERQQLEIERIPTSVPLPTSPVAERFPFPSVGPGSAASSPRKAGAAVQVIERADSPLLSALTASTARPEEGQGNLMDEELPESVGDVTMLDAPGSSAASASQVSGALATANDGTQTLNAVEPAVQGASHPSAQPDSQTARGEIIDSSSAQQQQLASLPTQSASVPPSHDSRPSAEDATIQSRAEPRTAPAPDASSTAAPLAIPPKPPVVTAKLEPKARKPALPPVAPRAPVAKAGRPLDGDAKLPPVTAVRTTKPRVPSAEIRKPFRPTKKPALPPATAEPTAPPRADSSTDTQGVAKAASERPTAKSSKAPVLAQVSRPPVASSKPAPPAKPVYTTTAKPTVDTKVSTTATTTARPAVSNLTKPTAASTHRGAPAAAPTRASKPPLPSTTVSLPAVKKDKVKRKAAVPSFRPVRHTPASAGAGAGPALASSTMSSLSSSQNQDRRPGPAQGASQAKDIVAKVKVRPEAVPLPVSPGETRAKEIPLPESPAMMEFTGKVRVKKESLGMSVSASTSVSGSEERAVRSGGVNGAEQASPLASKIALPESPVVLAEAAGHPSTSGPSGPSDEAPPLVNKTPASVSQQDTERQQTGPTAATAPSRSATPSADLPKLDALGLPMLTSHRADLTPLSKASTAPPMSDWAGSDRSDTDEPDDEEEEEEEQVEERVIFGRKASGPVEGVLRGWTRRPVDISLPDTRSPEKDLIEFSAPSRSAPAALVAPGTENALGGGMAESELSSIKAKIGLPASAADAICRVALSQRDANGNGLMEVKEVV